MLLLGSMNGARAADPAHASPIDFSITGSLLATDNGNLAEEGNRRADTVGSLRPNLRWRHRSAGVELDLDAKVTLVDYVNGTQPNAILPDVRASLRSTLVEQWLKLDAATVVKQTEANAFGPRATDLQSANRRTDTFYHVRPHVERLVASNTLLVAAYDLGLTQQGSGTDDRTVWRRGLARVEHLPDPFGAAVEWSRTDQQNSDSPTQRLALQAERISGNVALAHEWVLGVVAGHERSRFLQGERSDTFYGVNLRWDPSLRTNAAVNLEQRFFGWGGSIAASHRTPYLSIGLSLVRQPLILSAGSFLPEGGASLRTYLDTILTTRYPDETAREEAVNSIVRSHGLGSGAQTSSDVSANYPQLETTAAGHVTFLGRRTVVSLTWFSRTARLLSRESEPVIQPVAVNSDTRQVGASLSLSRRVAPDISAAASVDWARIAGLAARSGDVTRGTTLRASLSRNVSRHWTVSAGIQYSNFATSTSTASSYRATSALVGATYQF